MTQSTIDTQSPRVLDLGKFDEAYRERVLGNHFAEEPAYYHQHRKRYLNTIRRIVNIPLRRPARVLEIGGGQIVLLMNKLFGDSGAVADISTDYSDVVTKFGIEHLIYDLVHDEPLDRVGDRRFDLIVLCEVIEHMPIPPYVVLRKLRSIIAPGGWIFMTTPNLYRFRNVVRLATGRGVFNHWFLPERGQGIGHPVEYCQDHLSFHMREAGFDSITTELHQLMNSGATFGATVGRRLSTPLMVIRPLWRDNLIAYARNPG